MEQLLSVTSQPTRGTLSLALGIAGVILLTAATFPMQARALPAWAAAALAAGLLGWFAVAWKETTPEALPEPTPAPADVGRLAPALLASLALAAVSWTRTA